MYSLVHGVHGAPGNVDVPITPPHFLPGHRRWCFVLSCSVSGFLPPLAHGTGWVLFAIRAEGRDWVRSAGDP